MPSSSVDRALAAREVHWRRAVKDPIWLAENAWSIQHPLGERRFVMRTAQRTAIQRWCAGENSITLKARQIGWSTLVTFYVFWLAFLHPNTRIMLLSKGEREAQELLDKVKFGLERIPEWLKQRGPKVLVSNQTRLLFANGSEILSLPSGNNPARGFTGRLVVCDEFAFLENSEQAWASIEPTADIGGQLIILSTANGVGNKFHDLWSRAEGGGSVFTPMFFGWDAVDERDDAWYAQKKHDLAEWQLHQEYPSNPREAFIKSGMLVFNSDMLDEMEHLVRPEIWRGNLDGPGPQFPRTYTPTPNHHGYVHVWEFPDDVGSYVIGVDVAEGLGHGDYSSAHVVRIPHDEMPSRVVATWHGHMEADLFALEVAKLGWWYNTALVFPEVNNHGLTTVTELRRLGYKRIWRRMQLNAATKRRQMEWGWKTTRVTKPLLVDDLGKWLRGNMGSMPDPATLTELTQFVRDEKGGMSGSPHDDRVISLGLAVQAIPYTYLPEYQEEVRYPPGTLGWYEEEFRLWEEEQAPSDDWVIG